jgi:hypothetical protein
MAHNVGLKGTCSKCGQEKYIVYGFSTGSQDRSFCSDCLRQRCFCDICNKETRYELYSSHLKETHSFEEVVSNLTEYKVKYGFDIQEE